MSQVNETLAKSKSRQATNRGFGTAQPKAGEYTKGSVVPKFELIPRVALVALAKRFELGVENYGAKAWNALSDNQECLLDRQMLAARLGHVIDHATKALAILAGTMEDDGDDHAGAIMWGGSFAAAADVATAAFKGVGHEKETT